MFGGRKKVKHAVVSYATADRRDALALVAELEAAGVRVWVAPRDLDPTKASAPQIDEAVKASAALLMIVSNAANDSKVLKTEAELAVGHAPILTVRIADVTPIQALRSLVGGQSTFDLFGADRDAALARLADTVLALAGGRRPRTAAPKPAEPVALTDDAPDPAELPVEEPPAGPPPLGHNAALRHIIGPRANAYIERFRALEAEDKASHPFAIGLLFGRYWLAYRKMWLPALASSIVALLLVALALWDDRNDGRIGVLVAIAGIVLLGVLVWQRGIGLYRNHAERLIDRDNVAPADATTVADRLERHGGVSWPAALLLPTAELVAAAALALWLDPSFVAWLTTPDTAPRAQQLQLVDMKDQRAGNVRFVFCIANPTDMTINFTLRYGDGAPQNQTLMPHAQPLAFWSRSPLPPAISFDHILGDGQIYTDRTYGLATARTQSQSRCAGTDYYFTVTGNDVDLKLRDPDAGSEAASKG